MFNLATIHALTLTFLSSMFADAVTPRSPETASELVGVWHGEIQITRCQGDRHCPIVIGTKRHFFLRLIGTHESVRGVFGGDVTVDVVGRVDQGGDLLLTGVTPAASPADSSGEARLTNFVARRSASGLAGTLAYSIGYLSTQNREADLVLVSADIVEATRDPPRQSVPFQGHWKGRYVVRRCESTRGAVCTEIVGRTYPIDLTLRRMDVAKVSGVLRVAAVSALDVSLTGRVSANEAIIIGQGTKNASGGVMTLHVSRLLALTLIH